MLNSNYLGDFYAYQKLTVFHRYLVISLKDIIYSECAIGFEQ